MSNRAFLGHPVYIYRMSQNHRIAENLQNCNMKIHNFQFWSILYEIFFFSFVLKVSTEQRIFNTLEYTKKKGTIREFK